MYIEMYSHRVYKLDETAVMKCCRSWKVRIIQGSKRTWNDP